ncbi:MAG TPA: hypothetical protein VES40_21150 [Ilumatobacteraceae bacterium]|nr:hypothetical protein [Ilumatobacteraceae bacterium]
MTAGRIARAIGFTLATVILAVSGIYVVIDLARWEWNRAVISALVMIAALIVLVAMLLFRQLHHIEERMDALERSRPGDVHLLGALRSTNDAAAGRHFRWLERPPDGLGVFIPVLLGAGVLLSLAAYLVERVAGLFAAATLDPRTARELAPDLPLGAGLPRAAQLDPLTSPPVRRRTATAVLFIVTLALSLAAVGVLRELTQTRPKEVTAAGTTVIVLDIDQRRQDRPLPTVAQDLWGSCRSRLPGDVQLTAITQLDDERVQIEFDRSLGSTGRVRIVGCFQDQTLDRVRADVLSIESTPADR